MTSEDFELDDLKHAWKTLGEHLQRQNALQFAAFRERRVGAIRSNLRPLYWGQWMQMLFGIATVVAGVWLWRNFGDIVAIFVAAIAVQAYGVATIVASGVVLDRIAGIDSSLPVLELQKRLIRLRKAYIVGGAVVGMPWWLLWIVPPIVLLSLHAHQAGGASLPAGVWSWLGFGVAGLIGTYWFHRWSRKPGREALAKRLDDGAAGSSLRRAQAELDALKAYAEE